MCVLPAVRCAHAFRTGPHLPNRVKRASIPRKAHGRSIALVLRMNQVSSVSGVPARVWIGTVLVAWAAVVGVGLHLLLVYAYTPAGVTPAVDHWPASLASTAPTTVPLLVMFVHPECPCSRASLSELAVVMASARGRLHARVYIERAPDVEDGRKRTHLLSAAAAIPGVDVAFDPDGRVAILLHADVSGETHVYAANGRLIFRGGVTGARGHEGDNEGRRAVLALLTTPPEAVVTTPVFGCFLRASRS